MGRTLLLQLLIVCRCRSPTDLGRQIRCLRVPRIQMGVVTRFLFSKSRLLILWVLGLLGQLKVNGWKQSAPLSVVPTNLSHRQGSRVQCRWTTPCIVGSILGKWQHLRTWALIVERPCTSGASRLNLS